MLATCAVIYTAPTGKLLTYIIGLCVRRPDLGFPLQYPWKEAPREVETALTSRGEDIAKTRARNALKILLDVHGDFGRRSSSSA